ncbi:DUF302 domain-containing protein [Sphingomonas glacialis]|uniref:DUF302 domain-containing protein n=1 Tax=Sphingomonas glacialis TaxID=658225 RepID=UPI001386B4E4|nr:DUF302 domain-containing protein [Sphingomonas glacialis]
MSDTDFAQTLQRLDGEMQRRGITPVARIDHSAAAQRSGLRLPQTLLLVFGNPRLGTPLMQQVRTSAIDLPLKILIWEEADLVYIGYNDPRWIAGRHGLGEFERELRLMSAVLAELASWAAAEGV